MGGSEWAPPGDWPRDETGAGPAVRVGGPGDARADADDGSPAGGEAGRSRSWLIVVGLVVLLVGLVAVGLALAGGGDDGEPADNEASTASSAATTAVSTTITRPTTTTTAPPWQDVASADGSFHVSLPRGWASITVTGDMAGRGTEMFPYDSAHADLADQVLGILVTPQSRFVAMDGEAPALVDQTSILLVESGPSNVSQPVAYEAAKQHTEGEVRQEGTVQTTDGEANWFEYTPADVTGGIVARDYVLVRNGTAWLLTFWSGDMASHRGVADQLVGSFAPA
jgi:hypothetical protein